LVWDSIKSISNYLPPAARTPAAARPALPDEGYRRVLFSTFNNDTFDAFIMGMILANVVARFTHRTAGR
jgi:hypothetical protein